MSEKMMTVVKQLTEKSKRLEQENERLRADNERLRELLRDCQPYVENHLVCNTRLCDAVEKEVGDER